MTEIAMVDRATIAQMVIDQTPAVLAYVDNEQTYHFANAAYLTWFGRKKEDVLGHVMKDVIGSFYPLNLPYILGALQGVQQVFERKLKLENGATKYTLMTYKPNFVNGQVEGFFIHVADISPLKQVEMELHVERKNVKDVTDREVVNLRETNQILKRFDEISKEMSAKISIQDISLALYKHVHQILDSLGFAIHFVDKADAALYPMFEVLDGEVMLQQNQRSPELAPNLRRCVQLKKTIVERLSLESGSVRQSDSLHMLSVMATPLMTGTEIFGVMSIRSNIADSYGEREELIFTALSSYAANSLINANAYQKLQDAKEKLVENEKMATLGSMVACLAHALNTPLGSSLLASTTVEDGAHTLKQMLSLPSLKKSELERQVANLDQASQLVSSNLRRTSKIVESFKLVSVDQSSELRQAFNVRDLCTVAVAECAERLGRAISEIHLDVPIDIHMVSYPHPLKLVLVNLLENAVVHAFSDGKFGAIRLSARQSSLGQLTMVVSDDGVGIHRNILTKIFDPFFTTKMVEGRCGLGLNICYNIVTFVLEGNIDVESEVGRGTTFILDVPQLALNA